MNIGLIAHDSKKNSCRISALLIVEFYVKTNFMQQERQETDRGGHQLKRPQISGWTFRRRTAARTQIEHNEIDLVIFLRDPLTPKSHEPDVNTVVRICDTHNIPLATNLAAPSC